MQIIFLKSRFLIDDMIVDIRHGHRTEQNLKASSYLWVNKKREILSFWVAQAKKSISALHINRICRLFFSFEFSCWFIILLYKMSSCKIYNNMSNCLLSDSTYLHIKCPYFHCTKFITKMGTTNTRSILPHPLGGSRLPIHVVSRIDMSSCCLNINFDTTWPQTLHLHGAYEDEFEIN